MRQQQQRVSGDNSISDELQNQWNNIPDLTEKQLNLKCSLWWTWWRWSRCFCCLIWFFLPVFALICNSINVSNIRNFSLHSWYLTFDSMSESSRRQCATVFFFKLIFFHPRPRRLFSRKFVTQLSIFELFDTIYIIYNGSVDGENVTNRMGRKTSFDGRKLQERKRRVKRGREKVKLGRMRIVSFWQLKCHFILHLHWLLSWPSLSFLVFSERRSFLLAVQMEKHLNVLTRCVAAAEWIWNKQKYISRITLISDGENIVFLRASTVQVGFTEAWDRSAALRRMHQGFEQRKIVCLIRFDPEDLLGDEGGLGGGKKITSSHLK